VRRAREAIQGNRSPSAAGDKFWELSGGVLFCAECGRRITVYKRRRKNGRYYYYYRCRPNSSSALNLCSNRKSHRADHVEGRIWRAVRDLIRRPEMVAREYDRLIERERSALRGDPEGETAALLAQLDKLKIQRNRAQDFAIEGLLSPAELRERLSHIDEQRNDLERQMAMIKDRTKVIEQLEWDKACILAYGWKPSISTLDIMTPEQKHALYKRLGLRACVDQEGHLDLRVRIDKALEADRVAHGTHMRVYEPPALHPRSRNFMQRSYIL
jgi:hypothetical protein